jgi:exodeoxyribonuclease V beta subunit
MQRLDPLSTPLTDFNLIEASAGTGKTYTITALYLRLVVEARIPVNRILVVTYTNAATKELRDRIRSRLAQIRHVFLDGHADPEDELGVRLLDLTPDRDHAIRRLSNALRGFDEAAIFTIHGFCKRVLGDNAFESGLSFDTELMADTGELLREIVEDFWRREFYPGSPIVVQYFLDQHASPDTLLRQIEPHLGKPYLKIITPNSEADGPALEQAFSTAFEQARDLWRQDRPAIEELLLTSPALNRQKYNLKSIPGWLEAMEDYLGTDPPRLAKFEKFAQFTTTKLQASIKKDQSVPHHAFFDACEMLNTACDALADYCRYQIPVKLLAYCNEELAVRKRREQVQSYDDLLLDLHAALKSSRRGPALIKTLHERYAAALIDEFQDTDPVQYEIFHHIYAGTGQPVFLVGDPKQAIYSFRGADIFAYLTARRDTTQQHTLDVNWRSDPRLLTALNAVFGAVNDQPFMFEGIPFHDAVPALKTHPPLSIQDQSEPPLQLWLLEPRDPKQPINKGPASEQAAQATAAEVARLLNLGARGQAQLGDRPLAGGDIAVLVRSHWQGRLIRRHLLRLNIPSVQHADDSVFITDEARQLEWLLAAVAEPGHEGRVRTALASDLFGLTGEELHRLREEEQSWARWLEKFQDYRQLWQEQGFMRFFRTWLIQEGVPQRLLSFRDGDRRLTNLLHLAELSHIASRAHPGMASLLKWLGDTRRLPSHKDEEQQLRLESDENLVRIVTVHKSKGLEYEVVFCPFLWDGRLRAGVEGDALLYHDPEDSRRSILAIGAGEEDAAVQLARREEMAESLRLFYVALTRAKQRCYLVWGKIKDADTAPAAWLLHHPTVKEAGKDWLQATQEHFQKLDASGLRDEVQRAFTAVGDTVVIKLIPQEAGSRYQPPATQEPELQARGFSRSLAEFWRVGSFTSLTSGLLVEMPDYDMTVAAPATPVVETAPVGLNVFTFPRGARAGTCLHTIFERLDFSRSDREVLEERVRRTLTAHGLDAEVWTATVADWVERILATPLDGNELRLRTVTLDRRINEMEFYYPVAHLRDEALRRLLEQHGYMAGPFREMIDRLEFSPLRGYMKGFIDLVFEADGRFYLVDYKSNWLGPEPAAYQSERLAEAMAREAYVLQYLIYTVALHRYLRLRMADYDYEQHFGGVYYLFLRGMDPALGQDCGVFQDRPAPELVTALDGLMARGR